MRPFLLSAPRLGFMALTLALATGNPLTADTIASSRSFVPLVHTKGASGEWRTDLTLFNPEPERAATVDLLYTPAGSDGTNAQGKRFELLPRMSVTFKDVLCNNEIKFDYCSGYGLADIHSYDRNGDLSILVTSNTYNIGSGAGTFGQFVPAFPARKALGFSNSVFGDLYCPGLPYGANIIVNAAVLNASAFPLTATVLLTDRFGVKVAKEVTLEVLPYSMEQLNNIYDVVFASAGPFSAEKAPYRLTFFVSKNNGARILAYATVTDTDTGDPYLITAEPMRP
ncbi:MAG: hypothetical protein L6R30_11350 [Thermoanaerobaculia bacterium]|nr:hypothetical protein [Thermoanaerobaculia bacterium]